MPDTLLYRVTCNSMYSSRKVIKQSISYKISSKVLNWREYVELQVTGHVDSCTSFFTGVAIIILLNLSGDKKPVSSAGPLSITSFSCHDSDDVNDV